MPLPSNGTLSLQGYSKPGENETITAPPKQAMIVRMSAETLDALERVPQPQMEVSFEENSVGIYIGETFFPMRPSKEFSPHELYLRSSSAAKPMAPLKLYATVTGRFNVQRVLDSKITDRIRRQTQAYETQRQEGRIQVLEMPPDARVNGRKAPATSSSTSLIQKAAHNGYMKKQSSLRVPSPLPPPRPSSPSTSSPSTSALKDSSARRQMVQCLAISNRLPDDVILAIGGSNADASTKQNLRALLDEIAEPEAPLKKGDKSPRQYALKKPLWLEVRPHEWELTETERTKMLRAARVVFRDLRIPQSDTVWEHVMHRNTGSVSKVKSSNATPSAGSGSVPSSSTTAKPKPRKGVMSKEVKEKPKARSSDVQMKNESTAARVSSGGVKKESVEPKSTSIPPGTGKRASNSVTKIPKTEASATPTPTPARTSDVQSKKLSTPADSRSMSKQSITSTPTAAQPVSEKKPATMRISKKPTPAAGGADDERDSLSASTSLKRKKPDEDGQDKKASASTASQKKRKAEDTPPTKSEPKRDLSLPKKPPTDFLPSTTRPKLTASPLPTPAHPKELSRLASSSSTSSPKPRTVSDKDRERGSSSKPNGSSKSRREITYTSSENDDEDPIPQNTSGSGGGGGGRLPAFVYKTRPPLPSPSDHTALRKRYSASYQEYIELFTMMVQQKRALEQMLKSGGDEVGVELLESKELAKLASEHKRLKCELEEIKQAFLTGKSVEMSD